MTGGRGSRRRVRLAWVKVVRARGRWYHYFRTPDGLVAMPSADDADIFKRAHVRLFKMYRGDSARASDRLGAMVNRYYRSDDFTRLARNTRHLYARHIGYAVDLLTPQAPVTEITRADLRKVAAAYEGQPGTANMIIGALSGFFRWLVEMDVVQVSPTKGIRKRVIGEHQPWPGSEVQRALTGDDSDLRRIVALILYTGQRSGDVCKMAWSHVQGGYISVRQQKTGKSLLVPIHPRLQAELDAMPRTGVTLLVTRTGRSYSTSAVLRKVKAFNPDLVAHGLRKNAVIALLESGCTADEVRSITGQTDDMIRHYARQISQKKMAGRAISKWSEQK